MTGLSSVQGLMQHKVGGHTLLQAFSFLGDKNQILQFKATGWP